MVSAAVCSLLLRVCLPSNTHCAQRVRTELIEKQIELCAESLSQSLDDAAVSLLSAKQPSLEFVKVDDLADIVAFLAGPSARQITGVALPVDGAWTSQ